MSNVSEGSRLVSELNESLEELDHEHLIRLLQSHLEECSFKSKKVMLLDEYIVVEAYEDKTSQDYRIRAIKLAGCINHIPPFVLEAIKEILYALRAKDMGEAIYEIYSDVVFSGRLESEQASVYQDGNGKYFLKIKYQRYAISESYSDRTQIQLQSINDELSKTKATRFLKIFMLFAGDYLELGRPIEVNADVNGPKGLECLRRIKRVLGTAKFPCIGDDQEVDVSTIIDAYNLSLNLSEEDDAKFKRSIYWIEKYQGQNVSDYLLHLAISLETLIGKIDYEKCDVCGSKKFEESSTQSYKNFMVKYAPIGKESAENFAKKVYAARSSIAHSGKLSATDDPSKKLMRLFTPFEEYTEQPIPIRSIKKIWSEVVKGWIYEKSKSKCK